MKTFKKFLLIITILFTCLIVVKSNKASRNAKETNFLVWGN